MPRSRRSPNRIDSDGRLIDDAGNEWHLVNRELTRDEVDRLLADPDVRVGIHAQRALVRWVAAHDRQRTWIDEIEPHFHDHRDAAEERPFHATSWRRRGQLLLLFDDFD